MSFRRTVPAERFRRPPPSSALQPSRAVRFEIVTLPAVGWISNRRSTAVCSGEPNGAAPPSMIVTPAPLPVMVSGPAMSKSPSQSSYGTGSKPRPPGALGATMPVSRIV